MLSEFIAGGVVVTGIDLLSAALTLAYIGRLVFEGMFNLADEGGCYVVKRSLERQQIVRRAR